MTIADRDALPEVEGPPIVAVESEVEELSHPSGALSLLRPQVSHQVVSLKLFLRLGALFEADGEAGLSNLLQHLLLKGTVSRDANQLAEALAGIGSHLTVVSGREFGVVSLKTTLPHLPQALELLKDVLTQPALDPQELERERALILKEIQAAEDQPLYRAFRLLQEAFYRNTPLHKPGEGYPQTVERLTHEDVTAYRRQVYVPANCVLGVVGAVAPEVLAGWLNELWPALPEGERPSAGPVTLEDRESEEVVESRETTAAWLVVGYPAPALSDPNYPTMLALEAILGGSMSSRLFQELRERRGLAYEVATVYQAARSPSLMAGYLATKPGRLEEARSSLIGEFKRLREEPVPADELELARRYLKGSYIITGERVTKQAERLGLYELLGLGRDFGVRTLRRVEEVTPEDVRQVAEQYFRRPWVAAVVPRGERGGSKITKR